MPKPALALCFLTLAALAGAPAASAEAAELTIDDAGAVVHAATGTTHTTVARVTVNDEPVIERRVVWSESGTPPPPLSRALVLDPRIDRRRVGETHRVVATTTNVPAGGQVAYNVSGPNATAGTATVGVDGRAEIRWVGLIGGRDELTAFADADGDGVRDRDERTARAVITWYSPPAPRRLSDLPGPVPFSTVNLEPVGGVVHIKPDAPGTRWLRLRQASPIQVGTLVDVSRGEVLLQSATDPAGSRTQVARLSRGRFVVRQARARRPVTELVVRGRSRRCDRRSARRVVRSLRGSGGAVVRVTGRHATATMLGGAKWTVQDRCDGTRTVLARRPNNGRAKIREHSGRRTVRLRAGRSHLAGRGRR